MGLFVTLIIILSMIIFIMIIMLVNNTKRNNELNYNNFQLQSKLESVENIVNDKKEIFINLDRDIHQLRDNYLIISKDLATSIANYEGLKNNFDIQHNELNIKLNENITLQTELKTTREEMHSYKVKNEHLLEKNEEQRKFIEELNKKFSLEFEVMANKLLDSKSEKSTEDMNQLMDKYLITSNDLATTIANYEGLKNNFDIQHNELNKKINENITLQTELNTTREKIYSYKEKNENLLEKNEEQRKFIEELNKKFLLEFENIANKLLESKSEKFTELNKKNIANILEPLSLSINGFKELINNVYDKESKERFSLGEKVKDLESLNQKISMEANNLTNALKGDFRLQGDWGEVILTNILEKSGLRENQEYFLQQRLKGEEGNYIVSNSSGKKMIPDVVIKYPDNRHIIIDSKVSLNSFLRANESKSEEDYNFYIKEHLVAVKKHINDLSEKAYDDYQKTLDFVLMFIPSEAAYIKSLQGDANLWEYAYDKRILLINPTNLIACLKLISDLWKREIQSQNALQIAERGAKLYDKFVGFVENMDELGVSLKKAEEKYTMAYKQLSTGRDNLIKQSSILRDLGIKNKKTIPEHLYDYSENSI